MSQLALLILISLSFTLPVTICNKPIIAMYANCEPDNDTSGTKSAVTNTYVRWLQEWGAEVMVIQPWHTIEQIDTILSKINGVVFQGGSREFRPTENWEKSAKHIIQHSINLHKKKEVFPIIGICLGFQLFHQLISEAEKEEDIFERCDNSKVLSRLIFTEKTENARLFSLFSKEEKKLLSDYDSTSYFHTFSVTNTTFNKFAPLSQYIDITSLGLDKQKKEFINSIEGKDGLPIYGTQFHPEKTAYDRAETFIMPHTIEGRKVSQLIGFFFVSEARRSKNTMTEEERKKYDFITSYSKGNYDLYDENQYYFSKKSTKCFNSLFKN